MQFVNTYLLPFADLASKIAAIVLVFGLWVAYKQYRRTVAMHTDSNSLAKKNAQREAVKLAAERADHFGSVIIPQMARLDSALKAANATLFTKVKFVFNEDSMHCDASGLKKADFEPLDKCGAELSAAFNAIEGFAVYFASDVADDNIGYLECGRAFISFFEKYFLVIGRQHQLGYFKAMVALYWRWKKRCIAEDLAREHSELRKKIEITQGKLNQDDLKPRPAMGC